MFDAFRQWDLNYALAWSRRVEKYNPRWIEEPFQSANLDAFIEFSRETSIPCHIALMSPWEIRMKFLVLGERL